MSPSAQRCGRDKALARDLYLAGLTQREVAERFGVKRQTVRTWLVAEGVVFRDAVAKPVVSGPRVGAGRQARYRENLRTEVFAAYGGACSCCGTTYLPHLCLDHVRDDGNVERASGVGNRNVMTRLRRQLREGHGIDSRYQVLCWNCNMMKAQYGRCECGDGHN